MSNRAALQLPTWYLKAYCTLVVGVFFLIALGGSVRIMKAGLACPDWPLCFGDVIPDYHPQVYFEFIHRVVAGSVALVTLILQVILFRSRVPAHVKAVAALSLVALVAQIVFGALTVVLLLQSAVVATHLLLGTGYFASLLWIYLTLKHTEVAVGSSRWRLRFSIFLTAAVYGQILLGGLVAANFASLACTDFPKCQGEWFPTFRGIIGLHVIHRLGAYTIFTLLFTNFILARHLAPGTRWNRLAGFMMIAVCGQVALGIANVLLYTPPLIAVAHLALGVGVLSLALRQVHAFWWSAAEAVPAYGVAKSENQVGALDVPIGTLPAR